MGALPPRPRFERNRASILTPTKNIRPRAMGHPALGSLASPASMLARACFLFTFRRPRAFILCPSQAAETSAKYEKTEPQKRLCLMGKNCGTAVAIAVFFFNSEFNHWRYGWMSARSDFYIWHWCGCGMDFSQGWTGFQTTTHK